MTSDDEKRLRKLLHEIREEKRRLPKVRPIFCDNQVLSFEDIIPGNEYWLAEGNCAPRVVTITSEAYLDEYGLWRFDYEVPSPLNEGEIWSCSKTLADAGVISYDNGGWNRTNYIALKV